MPEKVRLVRGPSGHPELRCGGRPVKALNTAQPWLCQPGEVEAYINALASNGWNELDCWIWSPWGPEWPQPWRKGADGRYILGERQGAEIVPAWDETFWTRLESIQTWCDRYGIGVRLTVIDGCSMRAGIPSHAIAPGNHTCAWEAAGLPLAMLPADWASERADRWLYLHNWDGQHAGYSSTGYHHPAQWHLIRRAAAAAKAHGDRIQLWNELFSDRGHAEWDVPIMASYVRAMLGHVRDIYPGCIVSVSTGMEQELALAPLVDLLEGHGLAHGCHCYLDAGHPIPPGGTPSLGIDAGIAAVRAAAPGTAIAMSDDGCQSVDADGNGIVDRREESWRARWWGECLRLGLSYTHKGAVEDLAP